MNAEPLAGELDYHGLYAAWRADRITDSGYRAELRRRIAAARELVAGSRSLLTHAGQIMRGKLLDAALEAAGSYTHYPDAGELVLDATLGLDPLDEKQA